MDQIAPANRRYRRNPIEVNVPVCCRRTEWIAEVRVSPQREVLVPADEGICRDRIAEIRKQAGTDMKTSGSREYVVGRFDSSEAEMGIVVSPIFVEIPAIAENVEAGAQVAAVRYSGCDLGAHAKQRCLHPKGKHS